MAMDGAAAAKLELEGETVQKVLFPDEAEVSRKCEQKRHELIHQHENPRKPMPLMDLNMQVHSDLNVKVHSERRSKSMHRLVGRSEMAESTRTIHFIPTGSESTHCQQQGARPKQPAVSVFPNCQQLDAVANDAINAIGTTNTTTILSGIRRGIGNCFLLP